MEPIKAAGHVVERDRLHDLTQCLRTNASHLIGMKSSQHYSFILIEGRLAWVVFKTLAILDKFGFQPTKRIISGISMRLQIRILPHG